MARVVAPVYDYNIEENDRALTYRMKTRSRGRMLAGLLLATPFAIFAWFAILGSIFALFGNLKIAQPISWLIAGIAAALIAIFLFRWALSKKLGPRVTFDRDSITVGRNRYLFSHITYLGYRGTDGMPGMIATGIQGSMIGLANAVNQEAGYYVYITYGSQDIPIISGLDSLSVERVYERISRFLNRFHPPAG